MRPKFPKTLIITIILLSFCYLLPSCYSDGYTQAYQLIGTDGSTRYRLNIGVSQSLYAYYLDKSHKLITSEDFARFVTPYALNPIADSLRQIYTDDEDFANAVLMITHQIPYQETGPAKYPAETIAENIGDCDLFSYIAASTMKANGLDTVLLYYEQEAHMNVGVYIPHALQDARERAYYVTHNGVQYYVAECTGDNWEEGWRVGECPPDLKHATAQVITLESCEQTAPGQVSASYNTLVTSTIALTPSSAFVIQGTAITFSGQLTPTMQNKQIAIYVKVNNAPWTALGEATTDMNGRFTFAWNAEEAGIYYVRASWSGDNDYAVADSPIQTITVLSTFFVTLIAILIILTCIGLVVYFASRQSRQPIPEPEPPAVPY